MFIYSDGTEAGTAGEAVAVPEAEAALTVLGGSFVSGLQVR